MTTDELMAFLDKHPHYAPSAFRIEALMDRAKEERPQGEFDAYLHGMLDLLKEIQTVIGRPITTLY